MSFHFPISFKGFIKHRGILKRAVSEKTATTNKIKNLYKQQIFISHMQKGLVHKLGIMKFKERSKQESKL